MAKLKRVSEKESSRIKKLILAGKQRQDIAHLMGISSFVVTWWATKFGLQFHKIIKYCKSCKKEFDDETCNQTRYTCGIACYRRFNKGRWKKKAEIHYIEKGRQKYIESKRKFPSFKCENGHLTQLTFNPLIVGTKDLQSGTRCPKCIEQKTASSTV